MPERRYLTTTLPYVNADPHIGFALEIVQADALARYWREQKHGVFFNTGTDEHGVKIYRKALEVGQEPQAYVNEYASKFAELKAALNLSYDNFIRTTDPHHIAAAQEFWRRCLAAGDIYKKEYQVKYCVGCELEKTDSELENNRCPIHPNLELEIIAEENYFFRFSKYQQRLLDLYKNTPNFVVPESRQHEIAKFVERGLEDFSISRLLAKMPWGVLVPGDPEQVMYVWFDALINYVSAIGWPTDTKKFNKWWPVIQLAGKDNLRQQAAMWQAMLMSAGLPASKQILIHGFITSGGQKMSKSLGNVINPFDLVKEYGTDAVRYFLLRHVHPSEDSDVTLEKFKEVYNANLANGLGNLVSRVMKLAESYLPQPIQIKSIAFSNEQVDNYRFDLALDSVWRKISELDTTIQNTRPFEIVKTDPEAGRVAIASLVESLGDIANQLVPFLPHTAASIIGYIESNKMPPQPLFPRKD